MSAVANPSAIEVKDVHKSYGSLKVLKGISLEASKGDVASIIGSSGSGTSTFLRCIKFLEIPDQGSFHRIDAPTPKGGFFQMNITNNPDHGMLLKVSGLKIPCGAVAALKGVDLTALDSPQSENLAKHCRLSRLLVAFAAAADLQFAMP